MAENQVSIKISADAADARSGIEALGAQIDKLAGSLDGELKASAQQAAAGQRELSDQSKRVAQATQAQAQKFEEAAQGAKKHASAFDGLKRAAAGYLGIDLLRRFVETAAAQESMQKALDQLAGSTKAGAAEMEYLRATAARLGVGLDEAAKSYVSLAASTKGTALEGEKTRAIFEAVTGAMSKLGKTGAETQTALLAISQMASKGTVAMEELRGQLGESLPGAMQAAANGLGLTTAELGKLVQEGKITAEDLLPKLADELNKLYGTAPPDTLNAAFARLKTAVTGAIGAMAESGTVTTIIKGAMQAAGGAVAAVVDILNSAIEAFGLFAKTVAAGAASIVQVLGGDLKGAWASFKENVAQAAEDAAASIERVRKTVGLLPSDTEVAAQKAQQLGTAVQQAGQAAAASSPTWVKLASDYGQVSAAMKDMIDAAEKAAIARDAEAKASVAMAQAFGNEIERITAKVAASQSEAEALTEVARLRLADLEVKKAELQALQRLAAAQDNLSEEKKKQLEELQKEITQREAAAQKAVAQAQAARTAAAAAQAEAEAHKDNSGRLAELAKAYEEARAKAEALRREKAAGKATTEQVEAADLAAGKAAALYRDALDDVAKQQQARQIAEKASAEVLQISLNAEKQRYQAMIDAAKANGDYATALYATIEQRKVEIKIIEAKVQAMRAEADGAIAVAKAELAVLEASGKVDPVRRAQLEASIKVAEAHKKEADALALSGQAIQSQIDKLRSGAQQLDGFASSSARAGAAQGQLAEKVDSATRALERQNAELERSISAEEKANELKQRAIDLENKRLGIDREGYSIDPATGQRIVANIDPVVEKARSAAKKIRYPSGAYVIDPEDYARKYAFYKGQWDAELAAEAERGKASAAQGTQSAQSAQSAPYATAAATAAPPLTTSVTIHLNGGSAQIPTTQEGARALVEALKKAQLLAA